MSHNDLVVDNERLRAKIERNKDAFTKLRDQAVRFKKERDIARADLVKANKSHRYWYDKAGELAEKLKFSGGGGGDLFGDIFGGGSPFRKK